jgi:tetratricopeptide (TPR) repeat protein
MQVTKRDLPRIFWLLALTVCLYACYRSIRYAAADIFYQKNTPESLDRSIRLDPGNASYRALLAEHMEGLGQNPEPNLLSAASLSPQDSRYWIRLGFRAETQGKFEQAERYLLHASRIDRKFDPRWALMNFYFRQNRRLEFWRWTERAFEFAYGDLTPLFDLAWAESPDEAEEHIPQRTGVHYAYLGYLISHAHLEKSAPIALKVSAALEPGDDTTILMDWWDRLHQSDPVAGQTVWNNLCRRGVLPFSILDPEQGKLITNGGFSAAITGRGYDWRFPNEPGVLASPDQFAHELSVELSGKEREDLTLAEEWIPVAPGRRYVVSWEFSSREQVSIPGLRWTVTDGKPEHGDVVAAEEFVAVSEWKTGRFLFSAEERRTARLSLHYTRPSGSTRAEGTVMIRNIAAGIAE